MPIFTFEAIIGPMPIFTFKAIIGRCRYLHLKPLSADADIYI